ncbi:hypothetical protein FB45DRAFT_863686 [Roridomyces roridus]|uniref:DUF302 domain-containing protein n=1 Tax=Roridomyces roridus TaxID=1738132 RepID=A0AAD7FR80_9AGAR|nr:hypothetical protein FB45DRAFT_863686 [Roridomyces roridus]
MAAKTVNTYPLQLVTYSTTLPTDEVIARLDVEVAKSKCPGKEFDGYNSKDELEAVLNAATGPSGLMFVLHRVQPRQMAPYYQTTPKPPTKTLFYITGNPIIAETMIRHDIRASYNVPPRILIIEKESGGTDVVFHLPSSVIYLNKEDMQMKAAAEALDRIMEGMAERITAV